MYGTLFCLCIDLFLIVPWAGLRSVIMAFPGYTHSEFLFSVCIQVRFNSLHAR